MYVVIYRGFVFPEKEQEYIEAWKKIACYFKTHRGAIGSALHKTEKGEFIAYSRWPTKEVRDLSWQSNSDVEISHEIDDAIRCLKSCLYVSKPNEEINMSLVEDFLAF